MSHGHFFRALKEFGVIGTIKKIHKMRTLKFGRLIGVDKYGNEYYENTVDYPHGQHRWIEYAGSKTFYEVDASNVPPEWHSWLHGVTEAPPTERTVGTVHKGVPIANCYGASTPYKRNLGGVVTAHTPNLSQYRPRGYNLDNGLSGGSKPNEELYYTQPGWPMDKRNVTRRSSRKDRLGFDLKDTEATLKAKAAVRAGIPLDLYENASNTDTLLGMRLALTNSPAVSDSIDLPAPAQKVLDEQLPVELPSDPSLRERAVRVATGTGHARTWGDLEAGTFAAAARDALTAEEQELWSSGVDEDELLNEVARYQTYIDTYATVPNKAAAAGVEAAKEKLNVAVERLELFRGMRAKLQALNKKYDEMAAQALAQRQAAAKDLA